MFEDIPFVTFKKIAVFCECGKKVPVEHRCSLCENCLEAAHEEWDTFLKSKGNQPNKTGRRDVTPYGTTT
jgi:hypothetical protein